MWKIPQSTLLEATPPTVVHTECLSDVQTRGSESEKLAQRAGF